jgi:hypothetical protein
MLLVTFFRALLPLLIIQAALFVVVKLSGTLSHTVLWVSFAVMTAVLPLIAGFRVSHAGGRRKHACLGGVTISALTAVLAAITNLFATPNLRLIGTFILATVVFSLPLQAMSGLAGAWVSERVRRHGS